MRTFLATTLLLLFAVAAADVRAAEEADETPAFELADVYDEAVVRDVQNALALEGYDPGPANGVYNRLTFEAMRAYQGDWGMEQTGDLTEALYDHLYNLAPETEPRWEPVGPDGCLYWNDLVDPRETFDYAGGCVDGKVAGEGVLTHRWMHAGVWREERYEGAFRDGSLHGPMRWHSWTGAVMAGVYDAGVPTGEFTSTEPDGVRAKYRYEDGRIVFAEFDVPDAYVVRGTYENGDFAGDVVVERASGERYEGPIQGGAYHGHGRLVAPDGEIYEGDFRFGAYDGEGAQTTAAGDGYVGGFRGGLRHGHGVLLATDGETYDGDFADGEFHGEGRWMNGDGVTYVGSFRKGWRDGFGVYQEPTGYRYVGGFAYDHYHGLGVGTWPSGQAYIGGHRYGEFHGYGRLEYAGGDVYRGAFSRHMRHGEGAFRAVDGATYRGRFRFDLFDGQGVFVAPNGDRYVGGFKDGLMHGQGEMQYKLGDRYKGGWRKGQPHGQAFLKLIRGDLYKGGFREGYPDGEADYFYAGKVYHGRWIMGCFRQGDFRATITWDPETCPWDEFGE